MHLFIEHTTEFSYDHAISEAYTEMRLRPLDTGGQRCLAFSLSTDPRGDILQYSDIRGNDVRYFDVLLPHDRLVVSAVSEVMTPEALVAERPGLTPLEQFDYLTETPYTLPTTPIAELAAGSARADGPRAQALALMEATHRALKYTPGITNVKTTAAEAMALGQGVCQDFTHLMLAACRSCGLPARYVSGYLHSPGGTGAQATHAWVDVFAEGQGWISLDPTHNCLQAAGHVRVAVGRDYAEIMPTHGIYMGKSKETLAVRVNVRAV